MSDIQTKAAELNALLEHEAEQLDPRSDEDTPIELVPTEAPHAPEPEPAADRRANPRRKVPAKPARASKLAQFLPDAERVKIWKRSLGKRTYVRDYSLRDLQHAQDIESFIQTYIVPTFGEGDYDIDSVDAQGQVARTHTLSVMDPRKTPPGVSPADTTLGPVVDRLLARIASLETGAREQAAPKSMVEQIRELSQVQEMLGGQGPDAMTLWMLMQQQRPAAGDSAELAELRAELRALRDKAAAPPLPPPPPPEPAIDLAGIIRETTAASRPAFDLAELAKLLRPERSSVSDLVAAALQLAPLAERVLGSRSDAAEQARARELELLREQIRELKGSPGRGIRDVLEDMSAVTQFMGAVKRGPAREESFWSFLSNLVHQFPTTVESLGGLVERLRDDEPAPARPVPALPRPAVPRPAPAPAPAPAPRRPAAVPDDVHALVAAIESATDDPARIGATLAAFQRLGETPSWRSYLRKMMSLAQAGNQAETLKFLRSFLEGLRDAELLSQPTVDACVRAFDSHWNKVVELLGAKAPA